MVDGPEFEEAIPPHWEGAVHGHCITTSPVLAFSVCTGLHLDKAEGGMSRISFLAPQTQARSPGVPMDISETDHRRWCKECIHYYILAISYNC